MDRNFESASHNIASYMHPIFRQKAGAWYKAVYEVLTPRQITLGSKIIMIHLDNEMGIGDIMEGTPFATTLIDALETTDIPVSYV